MLTSLFGQPLVLHYAMGPVATGLIFSSFLVFRIDLLSRILETFFLNLVVAGYQWYVYAVCITLVDASWYELLL